MKYQIATISGCEALTELRMQMRKELDLDFNWELIYAEALDFFKRNIKSGAHIAFVCEHDGWLIATVGITLFEMVPMTKHPNGKTARLMNMYVEPSYRHRRIVKLCDILCQGTWGRKGCTEPVLYGKIFI